MKSLDDFYADARANDGKQSQCKRCMNDKSAVVSARWREDHPERVRATRQSAKYREGQTRRQIADRKRNPAKYRAYKLVARAVKNGKLIRPEACERCGQPCKPQAHHDDYDRPLDVLWLCPQCHSNTDARRPRKHL